MINEQRGNVLHGILLIALFSFSAFYIAEFDFVRKLSFSPLIVGILLGMVYANSLRNHLPETWVPGIRFCSKQLLRLGIVLYGFRLTFAQVAAIGLPAIAVDAVVVVATLLLGVALGSLMKMDADTALMTATGSSICGAAAVLGAEGVVRCEPHKTAVAVSTVVIFGTVSMFLYPALWRSGLLALTPEQMAVYTGSTLHEVAHVVGAGNAMGPEIADAATITKMIRVMMLAPVLLVMSFFAARRGTAADAAGTKRTIAVPWFAFGFLAVIGFNSFDLLPQAVVAGINEFDTFLLTMAMTALGTETSFAKFRQAGARPFLLAGLLYVWLLAGGYALSKYLLPLFG
ncbi:YeiH family protein [uncultured Alistipes sp.]|uniref:YeiH family protein n=1 Tax=uncultured Alistipes sp. TaxID=538949 RepID=UPI0026F1DE2D|nr:YeiH family protein [uncultured Alistipes sp.]